MKKLACLSVLLALTASLAFAETPAPAKPYPLKTCLVSGEKLDGGDMGKPYQFDYKGQTIVLCCKSCLKKFNKEPEKYLKKLQEK